MNVKRVKQEVGPARAVLYARTSKDDSGNATSSIAGQLEMGREYAQRKGWVVVAELKDDGVSGARLDAPALNEALDIARAGAFDIFVCRELDRLARSLAKQLVIEGELAAAGVELAFVLGDYAASPEGALMKNIRGVIAEYERLKITERMQRAKRRRVSDGNVITANNPPFGYRQVVDGKTIKLVIDSEAAETVRRIFEMYVDEGLGLVAVTRRLSELGILTDVDRKREQWERDDKPPKPSAAARKLKGRGEWSTATVATILKNETYAGIWRYSKGDSENVIEVRVDAIVDRQMFEAAQEQRVHNSHNAKRNLKHEYLLAKRVTCGACGAAGRALTSAPRRYYVCACVAAPTNYARSCEQRAQFRADQVDAAVWQWLRSCLVDERKLREGFASYEAERAEQTAKTRTHLSAADKLIADNQAQLGKLLDLYLSGDFPKEMLTERKAQLAKTLAALERERADLVAQLEADSLSEADFQAMMDFRSTIGDGLEKADTDFAARLALVELFDVRVRLAVEDGEKVVYPTCRFWSGERVSVGSTAPRFPTRTCPSYSASMTRAS